jgi:hypothetical protein
VLPQACLPLLQNEKERVCGTLAQRDPMIGYYVACSDDDTRIWTAVFFDRVTEAFIVQWAQNNSELG